MKILSLIVLSLLIGCGGGGGGNDDKECPTKGYPLFCSQVGMCCPPNYAYACLTNRGPACSIFPCGVGLVLDYCGEE